MELQNLKVISPDGLLQLTNTSTQQICHAFFKQPFDSSEKDFSFSTHFACALVPKPGADGGHGIAFISLLYLPPKISDKQIQNSTNESPSSQLLATELDTVQSAEFDDINKNHAGIYINSLNSIASASASCFSENQREESKLGALE